jgi:transcriptional regulator with XRE-family HTH domain
MIDDDIYNTTRIVGPEEPSMSHPSTGDGPTNGAGWEPIVGAIGPKIRQLRQQLGLSLQQLAARADVSAAGIHKVERGDMVPTITTLLKLAAALGRPISYFVDEVEQPGPVAVHVSSDRRPAPPPGWPAGVNGVDATGLAVPHDQLRGAAVHAVVAPGGSSGDSPRSSRGEELLLVLEGTLVVDVAGERYQVRAGDTLHYPADRPHRWHNPGPGEARAVWWLLHA